MKPIYLERSQVPSALRGTYSVSAACALGEKWSDNPMKLKLNLEAKEFEWKTIAYHLRRGISEIGNTDEWNDLLRMMADQIDFKLKKHMKSTQK